MVCKIRIGGERRKALGRLGDLLEIMGLQMATKISRQVSKSWREIVPDFRSCNAEAAGAE